MERIGLAPGGKTGEVLAQDIAQRFPQGVAVAKSTNNRLYAKVDRSVLVSLCTYMRDALDFEHVTCVGGVDWLEQGKMQVVYHITSYANKVTAELVVDLPRDKPEVDSITFLWGGANWHERETWDMFGIVFVGHPKLERLLNPAGTEVFPFRKDFVTGRRV
ncbi:MAG TPA: NADH-quinone oxidoreductase subunit C [Methanomassiliicoccales archaeon]|nr:NADH-quinone oxidoreductase subunit C [Methanomassiliicoccales archaeon]